ncbi:MULTISPECIES: LysM peptidoglycan-binding domain-containing protein [unclassified Marinovum]
MTNWTRVLGGGAVGVTVAVAAYVAWSVDGFYDADPAGEPAAALVPAPSSDTAPSEPVAAETGAGTSTPNAAVAESSEVVTDQPASPPLAAPTFDLIRIEPDGAALVAGQALAGADVTVFLDGDGIAATRVGSDGKFASLMDILPSRQPRVMTLSMRMGAEEVFAASEIIVAPFGSKSEPEQGAALMPEGATSPDDTASEPPVPVDVAALVPGDTAQATNAPRVPAPEAAQTADAPVEQVVPNPLPDQEETAQAAGTSDATGDAVATTDAPSPDPAPDTVASGETEATQNTPENLTTATATTDADTTAPNPTPSANPSQDGQNTVPNPVQPKADTPSEFADAPTRELPANGSNVDKPSTPDSTSATVQPRTEAANAQAATPIEQALAPTADPVVSSTNDAEVSATEIADAPQSESQKPAQILTDGPANAEASTPANKTQESDSEARTKTALAIDAPKPKPSDTAINDTATIDPAKDTPTLLASDQDGVRVLPGPEVLDRVAIDTISYDDAGDVALAGRGAGTSGGGFVRVYLDNTPITSSRIRPDGSWQVDLPEVDKGVYTLRVDEVGANGEVKSRAETPFKREDRALLERVSEDAEGNGPVKIVTVQPGNTLWQIARDRYGEGLLYVRVFKANTSQIRDPDLIYPGQVFDLPEEAETAN